MKSILLLPIILLLSFSVEAQYNFSVSEQNPFGKLNPKAVTAVSDYEMLIGESKCISVSRAPDQTWNPEVNMLWRFKYIMNGMAVQDETLKEDGIHSGSIRQFNADSSAWFVHYYTSRSVPSRFPVWKGGTNEDGDIILYNKQASPNGADGFYKIRFYDITESSFEWIGTWVNPNETIQFPTWKISCQKI